MRLRTAKTLLWAVIIACWALSAAWSMDEAVLTPTKKAVVAQEDKEFNAAMGIWLKHNYAKGKELLQQFSAKHPDSRWAAEADLHCGCFLTFSERYDEAQAVFEKLAANNKGNNIRTKATLRLGNVAEREARFDEAINYYTEALKMHPTWDQFRYANFCARKLIMGKGKMQAMINCGPVALAACLNALGKASEATQARQINPGLHGLSLYGLSTEAEKLGVNAQIAQMPFEQLKTAKLPVLAYVQPNHFVAVLGIRDGMVSLEDSIRGRHETSASDLKQIWSGSILSFASGTKLADLPLIDALEATGGCCAQADENECIGSSPSCQCQQGSDGPGSGGSGNGGGCPTCAHAMSSPASGGSPTWQMNTNNFNVMVTDTPIWYNPGKGPGIEFTLHYSNENSNTGIFGRGWRCQYDMIVHFLPPGTDGHSDLQLHRDDGRIETYVWNSSSSSYSPRQLMKNYGYHDTITERGDGTVVLTLNGGGKYFFVPEGNPAEGRIQYIEDQVGNRVTCDYVNGRLAHVIDASGGVTDITYDASGQYVTRIAIPEYDAQTHQPGHGNGRFAELEYTDGNLTSITDMAGSTSTLTYDSTLYNTSGYLAQDVTADPPSPADDGDLSVGSSFVPRAGGSVTMTGTEGTETVTYTSFDPPGDGQPFFVLHGVRRGNPRHSFSYGDSVSVSIGVPYLSTIVTPTTKAKFAYGWWTNMGTRDTTVIALRDVYECGRDEYSNIDAYPSVPSIHYAWSAYNVFPGVSGSCYDTAVTRYPSAVSDTAVTGGITRHYLTVQGPMDDALFAILDECGNLTTNYNFDTSTRNRTSSKDGRGNETRYTFDDNHRVTRANGPSDSVEAYTYYPDGQLHEVRNKASQVVLSYTYDPTSGQITRIDNALGTQLINDYDAQGRMDYTEDGRGKRTHFGYDENGETRGFLTSVADAEGNSTRYHYDARGRRDQVTDANNKTTIFEYDDLDRVIKVINPDGTFSETHYSCCHKEWSRDANGRVVKYDYDRKNRIWAVVSAALDTTIAQGIGATDTQIPLTNAAGFPSGGAVLLRSLEGDAEVVRYTGISGNVLTGVERGLFGTTARAFTVASATEGTITASVFDDDVVDGNGNCTHRGIPDRQIGSYDPNGHLTRYEYYANGSVKTITYSDNTWEQYAYDAAGNITTKKYGHDSETTKTIDYDYDASNRQVGSH